MPTVILVSLARPANAAPCRDPGICRQAGRALPPAGGSPARGQFAWPLEETARIARGHSARPPAGQGRPMPRAALRRCALPVDPSEFSVTALRSPLPMPRELCLPLASEARRATTCGGWAGAGQQNKKSGVLFGKPIDTHIFPCYPMFTHGRVWPMGGTSAAPIGRPLPSVRGRALGEEVACFCPLM